MGGGLGRGFRLVGRGGGRQMPPCTCNPPPPCIVIACARRCPCTPGNTPQMTLPSPRPITMQRTRDTKQDMQTQEHMNHKMSQKLPIGIHVQLH